MIGECRHMRSAVSYGPLSYCKQAFAIFQIFDSMITLCNMFRIQAKIRVVNEFKVIMGNPFSNTGITLEFELNIHMSIPCKPQHMGNVSQQSELM